MAGVKGRSGGARPGAGRPRKEVAPLNASSEDPVEFLREVMLDPDADPKLRVRAAIEVAAYEGTKKAPKGKKEGQQEAAEVAAQGKFAPAAPPKLSVVPKAS